MNCINLADPNDCPRQLYLYDEFPKHTGTGLSYLSYIGLRQYLITGKKNSKYLNVPFNNIQSSEPYVYVSDLKEQLTNALKLTVDQFPMLRLKLNRKTEVVWSGGCKTPAEQEWVEIVRAVLKTM